MADDSCRRARWWSSQAGRGARHAPAAPARAGQPPVDPYAPLAAGERMGTQCGQAQMRSLADPQGNKLVYAKVLEGSECYSASFTGFGADAKDNDIRIENKKTGAGVHITGDRPLTRLRVLVDPDGPRARALHRPQHRAGPAVHLDVHVRLLHNEVGRDMQRLVQRALTQSCSHRSSRSAASASAQSESAGVNQYFTNCASCHESNDPGHQAPKTAVLKRMTPERILEAMTTGSMRTAAAAVSDQDKRLIAEWVAGRKLDTDLVGAAAKMPNACASHPQVRESNAPAWNGWGVDYRNSRFQPGAAAGLSPGQVSRLQLKWAFGFPGATALYGQTVHDGRLYVTSNAGYVYSLDAETGCLHWGFRAESAVRSGFTHRPAQQDGSAARHLLRRHPRHRIRALRQHRRGDLEDAHRSTSARANYRYAGAVRRTCVRAGRVARRAGVGAGGLCLLHVPRLHVGPRFGDRPRDLEDVHDSRSPEGGGQELARQEHARAGRRRHLGDADARRQAARAVRHDGQRLLGHTQDRQCGDGDEHRHRQSAVDDAGARHSTRGTTDVCRTFPGGAFPARGGGGRGGRAGGPAIPYPPENCPDGARDRTGTLRRLPRWRQPPTDATFSSRRRSRASCGPSTRTTAR